MLMPSMSLASGCSALPHDVLLVPVVPALKGVVVLSAQVVVFVGAAGIVAHCSGNS